MITGLMVIKNLDRWISFFCLIIEGHSPLTVLKGYAFLLQSFIKGLHVSLFSLNPVRVFITDHLGK